MTPKEIFVQEMIKRGETKEYAEMRYDQIKEQKEKEKKNPQETK